MPLTAAEQTIASMKSYGRDGAQLQPHSPKNVASAILADVEPWLPARWKRCRLKAGLENMNIKVTRAAFPGGKMPSSTAGEAPTVTFHPMRRRKRCAILFRVFKKRRGQQAGCANSNGFCRFVATGTRVALGIEN
jgi:hypothetical protein